MIPRPLRRLLPGLLACGLAGLAGACDDEPSGPGSFIATVVPPAGVPAGAATVRIQGPGIRGVEGVGSSLTFTGELDRGAGVLRLVVVAPAGPLSFEIRVDDVGAAPAGVVVNAVDAANRPIVPTGYEVAVELKR